MLQAALAKFYGCSPADVRDLTQGEIAASVELARQLDTDG